MNGVLPLLRLDSYMDWRGTTFSTQHCDVHRPVVGPSRVTPTYTKTNWRKHSTVNLIFPEINYRKTARQCYGYQAYTFRLTNIEVTNNPHKLYWYNEIAYLS
jgi:hypothetical protein